MNNENSMNILNSRNFYNNNANKVFHDIILQFLVFYKMKEYYYD